jgi:WD40 repeat protein
MRRILSAFTLLLTVAAVWATPSPRAFAQAEEEEGYGLRMLHRINAHGDEYMGLAATPDGGRLVVGTEKGELLVWGVGERRIIRKFSQGGPIHAVIMLKDGRRVLAGGGEHTGIARPGVLRLWDLETGSSEDWQGATRGSVMFLSYDSASGLVAALMGTESIGIWSAETGRKVASWDLGSQVMGLALVGQTVYASVAGPRQTSPGKDDEDEVQSNLIIALDAREPGRPRREVVPVKQGRLWGELTSSPGGRFIAARFYEDGNPSFQVALLEASSAKELATFTGTAPVWSAPDQLLISDDDGQPVSRIKIAGNGHAVSEQIAEGARFHAAGSPAGLHGQVVSKDGHKVWAVYQQGAALVEWRLDSKSAEMLTSTKGFPFAMDVRESESSGGLLITGGDDHYVRVWNLADLSLFREFRVPSGVPQGVALLDDNKYAVFSYSSDKGPTVIKLADLQTGKERTLLEAGEPFVQVFAAGHGFVYNRGNRVILASASGETVREFAVEEPVECFGVSHNGRWLALAVKSGELNLFDVATGQHTRSKTSKIENISRIAVTNDGRYIYTTEWMAHIRRWDTRQDTSEDLGGYRGQSSFLRLSRDEKRIVIGGNHRDIGVYDAADGKALADFRITASDFYITNGWLSGDRLIFTTDSGVMFDGVLEK